MTTPTTESASGGPDGGVAPVRMLASTFYQVVRSMQQAYPAEGCGLLFGFGLRHRFFAVPNIAPEGERRARFQMDPAVLLELMQQAEDWGMPLSAVVHSHTSASCAPSRDDTAMAAQHPRAAQLIVARCGPRQAPQMVAYRYGRGALVRVALSFPNGTGGPQDRVLASETSV